MGASEIAALAGLSKWSSPIAIYEAKVLGTTRESSLRMELGDLLEEPIAKLYARETGRHLRKCVTLRHPEREIMLATPDRVVFASKPPPGLPLEDADRLLQIKTTGWRQRDEWGAPGTDAIPAEYLAQVQWEMAVTGVPCCDVAVLVDRDEFLIYTVTKDAELVEGLYEVAARFWTDHVLARVPPPPDASERYAEYLARVHPREKSDVMLPAPPEVEALAFELREAELRRVAAETAEDALKNQIRAFIGDAAGTTGSFGRITWKANASSARTDWEAAAVRLREELEQLAVRGGMSEEDASNAGLEAWRRAVGDATLVKPGARVLRKSWAKK